MVDYTKELGLDCTRGTIITTTLLYEEVIL